MRTKPRKYDGMTMWPLSQRSSARGLHAFKVHISAKRHTPPAVETLHVHEGDDWIYVLAGRLRLVPLEAADEVARALQARWPHQQPTVGVEALADGHTELRRAVCAAREARRAGQQRRKPVAVATYDHVGSHRALLAHHDGPSLTRFAGAVLGPVRHHDAEHRAELELTLRTFLAHGGRFNETASVLHVHVNTLRNRLSRIEELTGRDLGATEDRVDLFLALQAESDD